jgi:hypothetical protein
LAGGAGKCVAGLLPGLAEVGGDRRVEDQRGSG